MKQLLLIVFLMITTFAWGQSNDQGKQLLYYQKYISAEESFHRQLASNPADAEAWMLLVKTYLLQDKEKIAKDTLDKAPASLNESPFFWIAKAGALYANGNFNESRQLFEKAIDETKGKNEDILKAIAAMQIIAGGKDMSYALEVLDKAIKRDKNNPALYLLKGDAYRNLHDGSQAFSAYQEAIGKNKNYAAAYYRLGDLFLSQKNREMYMDYYNKAVAADNNFGPAYYELYNHYVYRQPDIQKALQYFRMYELLSDKTTAHDYAHTDLQYLNKNYNAAISEATSLIKREGESVQPRLYKLIAYSYADLKDSAQATVFMNRYLAHETDSNIIAKDYETMARLQNAVHGPDSAIAYLQNAVTLSKDSAVLFNFYKQVATRAAVAKDYATQAKWMALYAAANSNANNVDIFNWGIAAYRASEYEMADSAFEIYTEKYPEQGFGYYWRARSNAAIDTAMQEGLAIPYYNQLIEKLDRDSLSASDKKWMTEAFGYLAAYETNTKKDYGKAIEYFREVLSLDPENENVKNYITMLEANLKKEEAGTN